LYPVDTFYNPQKWDISALLSGLSGGSADTGGETGWVLIQGYGTIASMDGVLAGGGAERFWEIDVAETGRGSWVGLVAVPVGGEKGEGEEEEGEAARGGRGGWPDGDVSLSAQGWAIWGGETGDFHPMYIKGKSVDQILGFKAGQTVGLHLRPVRTGRDSAEVTTPALLGAGRGAAHELGYLIDGKDVCTAFLAQELPQDGSCSLHLAISNGWAGVTRVSARLVPRL
jgi:hypothetical protein